MSNLDTTGQPPAAHAAVGLAVLFSAAAALGGFLFGYDTAVINGAVNAIRDRYDIGAGATGLSVSLTLLGAALGAWVAGASRTDSAASGSCRSRPRCSSSAPSARPSRSGSWT